MWSAILAFQQNNDAADKGVGGEFDRVVVAEEQGL
jgi:hypothetical protein